MFRLYLKSLDLQSFCCYNSMSKQSRNEFLTLVLNAHTRQWTVTLYRNEMNKLFLKIASQASFHYFPCFSLSTYWYPSQSPTVTQRNLLLYPCFLMLCVFAHCKFKSLTVAILCSESEWQNGSVFFTTRGYCLFVMERIDFIWSQR